MKGFDESMLNLLCLSELSLPIQFYGFYDDTFVVGVLKLLIFFTLYFEFLIHSIGFNIISPLEFNFMYSC